METISSLFFPLWLSKTIFFFIISKKTEHNNVDKPKLYKCGELYSPPLKGVCTATHWSCIFDVPRKRRLKFARSLPPSLLPWLVFLVSPCAFAGNILITSLLGCPHRIISLHRGLFLPAMSAFPELNETAHQANFSQTSLFHLLYSIFCQLLQPQLVLFATRHACSNARRMSEATGEL